MTGDMSTDPPLELQLKVLFDEYTRVNDQRIYLAAQNQHLIAKLQETSLALESMRGNQPSAE